MSPMSQMSQKRRYFNLIFGILFLTGQQYVLDLVENNVSIQSQAEGYQITGRWNNHRLELFVKENPTLTITEEK